MANYFKALGYRGSSRTRTLAGSSLAGCGCSLSRPLAGYISTTLRGYRSVTLSGLGDPAPGTPALVPISDKAAVANAIKMFQVIQRQRAGGLGDAAQAQGAAAMAQTGAKVGSIIPGVGTVIGAVVGAVVGWLATKKKPVRASSAQVAACRSSLSEYMGYARQMPAQPLPLEREQLIDMNWCVQALYGPDIGLRDPRWFSPGFVDGLMPIARQIVRRIYETPVGQSVDLPTFSFRDPKGRTLTFKGFSFINPQFTDLKSFSDGYFHKVALEFCHNTAGKGAPGCEKLYAHEEWRRLLYDLLAWAARTELPNISESDLAAASTIAAQTGSAASDVVKAVEQIIGRSVERGDTSALLTPGANSTAPPGPAVPIPADSVPANVAPPAISAPALPPNASTADIQAAIAALTTQMMHSQAAQAMTQQQTIAASTAAAQQWLAAQGIKAPPAAVAETAKSTVTQAGGIGTAPLWLGGAALLFALARPARSPSRSSGERRR